MAFVHGIMQLGDDQVSDQTQLDLMLRATPLPGPPPQRVRARVGRGSFAAAVHGGAGRAHRCIPTIARRENLGLVIVGDLRLDARAQQIDRWRVAPDGTDVDVLADAVAKHGEELLHDVIATGAVAICWLTTERVTLWRDPLGVRPLYFAHTARDDFAFSSDLQSLSKLPWVNRELDLAYAKMRICKPVAQDHPIQTYLQGIQKVSPGGMIRWRPGSQPYLHRYWSAATSVRSIVPRTASDAIPAVSQVLSEAISDRIDSTVGPISAHVSGGLDSSGIAVRCYELLPSNRGAFTGYSWSPRFANLETLPGDERLNAMAVGDRAGFEVVLNDATPEDHLAVRTRDLSVEPTTTLHYEMASSRAAIAAGSRVVFSGWGGDETLAFNGRGAFAEQAAKGRFITLYRELRATHRRRQSSLRGLVNGKVVTPLLPDSLLARLRPGTVPAPAEIPHSLRPEFRRLLADVETLSSPYLRERIGVHRMQTDLLSSGHLSYRLESWAAFGARNGIEYHFPMLDRRVVELALSLPPAFYFQNGWKRWGYRTLMQERLPAEVAWNAEKHDFALARYGGVLIRAMRPAFEEALMDRAENPYFDVVAELRRTKAPQAGSADSAFVTWLAFLQAPHLP